MVGLSGGVDSAVAALLLQQQGFVVEGLFMKNWEEDDTETYCTAAEDLRAAQQVCAQLQIPLHTINFSAEYWDQVFVHFLQEYQAGRTPNPDILCNQEIKFKAFLEHARHLGADKIATGHYVDQQQVDGAYHLLKGLDPEKDQSYFLYTLDQHRLQYSLFPLGPYHKPQIRQWAQQAGFGNCNKKDSTGICFIGERPFRQFLANYLPAQPGPIVTLEGEVIGQHQGLMYYTLGQRQGLGIGGRQNGTGKPWFVVGKNLTDNQLQVVQGHDHPLLLTSHCRIQSVHWVGLPPATPLTCYCKTRYRQADQGCTLEWLEADQAQIRFATPQWAVTPGQSLVFYQQRQCLGGGIISQAFNAA